MTNTHARLPRTTQREPQTHTRAGGEAGKRGCTFWPWRFSKAQFTPFPARTTVLVVMVVVVSSATTFVAIPRAAAVLHTSAAVGHVLLRRFFTTIELGRRGTSTHIPGVRRRRRRHPDEEQRTNKKTHAYTYLLVHADDTHSHTFTARSHSGSGLSRLCHTHANFAGCRFSICVFSYSFCSQVSTTCTAIALDRAHNQRNRGAITHIRLVRVQNA